METVPPKARLNLSKISGFLICDSRDFDYKDFMMEAPKNSPKSPRFVKPLELFMMSKKKRLTVSPSTKFKVISPLKSINLNSPYKKPQEASSSGRKSTPKKRKSPYKENNRSSGSRKTSIAPSKRRLIFPQDRNYVPLINLVDEDANLEAPELHQSFAEVHSPRLPVDWSLKTRMRFISKKRFPFGGVFKASEDAAGTTAFVRCLGNQSPKNKGENSCNDSQCAVDTSAAARLRQYCFVWISPNIPWLKMFPRPFLDKNVSLDLPQESMECLFNEWTYSLRSLYHLVKAKQAAFFYLCSDSYSMLFRASGIGGNDEISAYVYPTTPGFRKVLSEAKVNFSMPFSSVDESQKLIPHDIKVNIELKTEDKDDSMMFLESLGLSQQDFPSLKQAHSRSSVIECSKSSSLVVIKGPDTQVLVTLLTSNRFCSKTGVTSSVPPTLLAPVAFQGGSLLPLKIKQTEIQHKGETFYSLEMNGPIIPTCVNNVCEYLRETQEGNFKASLASHEYSLAFVTNNGVKNDNSSNVFATHNLQDCGLSPEFVKDICCPTRQSCVALKEINLNNYIYTYI